MQSADKIMNIAFGFWGSKVLLSAIELGVFTVLAESPQSSKTLSKTLGLNGRGVADFLDSLVSMGILDFDGHSYSNSQDANYFLDRRKPTYIGDYLEMGNKRLYPLWGSLTKALLTGKPQSEIRGTDKDLFSVMYNETVRLDLFVRAMSALSRLDGPQISRMFPWQEYQRFADIGSARGELAVRVATEHEHLSGVGFDLPALRPYFEEYVRSCGLSDRLHFQSGNFFEDEFPSADVIIMGRVLQDWNLQEKRILISKAFDALPENGALIAYEAIIDDTRRENQFGLLVSMNMLLQTQGGFGYTESQCIGWMKDVGFRSTYAKKLTGWDSMIVGLK